MTDRISVITANESRVALGDYLVTDTSHRLQGRTFSLNCGGTSSKLKKRSRSIRTIALDLLSSPFNENDGLEGPSRQTIDMDSTATSRIKRPRTEVMYLPMHLNHRCTTYVDALVIGNYSNQSIHGN